MHYTNTNKGTQLSVAELQYFLSVACYLLQTPAHEEQPAFYIDTLYCVLLRGTAECAYIIYSLFASAFIDILIVNSLFNNPE